MSTSADSAPSTTGPVTLANGLQPLSCIRCAHRKVKCDRIDPCSNCVKHSIPCEYREGAPYKRKKKSHPEAGSSEVLARLEKYEEILKDLGVDPASVKTAGSNENPRSQRSATAERERSDVRRNGKRASVSEDPFPSQVSSLPQGKLIVHEGKSRYVEGNLWAKVGDVFEKNTSTLLPDSSDDEDDDEQLATPGFDLRSGDLVLGASPKHVDLHTLHPSPAHFQKLWQAFVDNVHPIIMILHAPSARKACLGAIKGDHPPAKDVEALLFAVMALSVLSMSDADCMKAFSQSRSSLLVRYRLGARQALCNAKFLVSSSFCVLQAYTLYLFAVRPELDARAMWNLSGIALRNSQRLGVHKDIGEASLTPFETEMRRRLGYQIFVLDIVAAQHCATSSGNHFPISFTPPANVNDSDLDPDMKEAPIPRQGATDMIFCRLRLKIFSFMRNVHADKGPVEEGRWFNHKDSELCTKEKDELIDELEKEIELEVLRYCDFLQPVHFLTTSAARLIICKMRFNAHHPRRFQEAGQEIPESEKDFLFKTALKVIEYDNIAHEQPLVKRFLWHSYQHFQWACLIQVLSELKTRTHGEEAERAWNQIQFAYEHRPDVALGKRSTFPLYAVVNKVALEAWKCREAAIAQRPDEHPFETPEFIQKLREQQATDQQPRSGAQPSPSDPLAPRQTPQQPQNYSTMYAGAGILSAGQNGGNVNYADMYSVPGAPNEEVDWGMFDTLINDEMMEGFGDAALGTAAFQSNYWGAMGRAEG